MHKQSDPYLSFNKILLEAIDEALAVLGESTKKAIYYHLKVNYNIKRNEIPFRIEDFEEAMEKIFDLGARSLEILFIKSLHAKVRGNCKSSTFDWNSPDFTFLEYVQLMKNYFEKNKNSETGIEVELNRNEKRLS